MSLATVPVLTAVTGAPWEATLVSGLERSPGGITVVRRCVDIADLLAAAASGTARAVLLSADLRRLDRDTLSRLAVAGVAVVGLVTAGDEEAERRLRQLGVTRVLPGDAPAGEIADAVNAAVGGSSARGASRSPDLDLDLELDRELADLVSGGAAAAGPVDGFGVADPHTAAGDVRPATGSGRPVPPGSGRLVAVWGPTGAPGRTTVAVTLATELARLGVRTLLADADVYGGVIAQLLGLLDESPGLAAAARLANNGQLDLPGLATVSPRVAPDLRLLSGIARADRWPELRPTALEAVYGLARSLAAVTVADCGFCLEQDEELSYDSVAPRRNGATLATLELADTVVAVCAADPVGVQRFVRGLHELREVVPDAEVLVVLNKVRRGPVGADPEAQLTAALDRYAGVSVAACVPADADALDRAMLHGRSLAEVAPQSAARLAVAALAARLGGVDALSSARRARRTGRRAGLRR